MLWDEFSTYGDVILETDGATGALLTRYLVGEELIGHVRSTPQPEVRFYLEDALGSTRLLVDNIDTITETFEYDAYGQLTAGDANLTDYPPSSATMRRRAITICGRGSTIRRWAASWAWTPGRWTTIIRWS